MLLLREVLQEADVSPLRAIGPLEHASKSLCAPHVGMSGRAVLLLPPQPTA